MATPDDFIWLIRLDQLPPDQGVRLKAAGKELAVFRLSDPAGVYAIDNACPQADGSLAAGDVLPGGVIRCPWQAWEFRLTDGESADGSVGRFNSHPIEIRGEEAYARLMPQLTYSPISQKNGPR